MGSQGDIWDPGSGFDLFNQAIAAATDFFAANYTPQRPTSRLLIRANFVTAANLDYMITRLSDSSEIGPFPFNAGVDLAAGQPYEFSLLVSNRFSYNFRHDDGGSITINEFLMQEVMSAEG